MTRFDPENPRVEGMEDLDEVVRHSERVMAGLAEAQRELAAVTGEGSAADGMVRAEVDGAGRIRRIAFDPRAARMDTAALAEAATEAVRAAQEEAARRNDELLRAATGGAPVTLDMERARREFEEIGADLARTLRDLTEKC
ncbi:YbaB/EbfC family nucleoid-associated protein [Streptosporangium sandarakinum]|uniref:YbaB/EbfC family nucleoid-associated protein n=1 Tax=Streptosporangium sandarakinum TaxID=1260955 RepID=UPI0036904EB0